MENRDYLRETNCDTYALAQMVPNYEDSLADEKLAVCHQILTRVE